MLLPAVKRPKFTMVRKSKTQSRDNAAVALSPGVQKSAKSLKTSKKLSKAEPKTKRSSLKPASEVNSERLKRSLANIGSKRKQTKKPAKNSGGVAGKRKDEKEKKKGKGGRTEAVDDKMKEDVGHDDGEEKEDENEIIVDGSEESEEEDKCEEVRNASAKQAKSSGVTDTPKKPQKALKSVKRSTSRTSKKADTHDEDNKDYSALEEENEMEEDKKHQRTAEARRAERKARKLMKLARAEEENTTEHPGKGVIYVAHLPRGFYEKALREFFTQFGEVLRVRVARSKKTARPKGFAYVEFGNSEVAKIAAKAMNGYLMLGRALVVFFVNADRLHEKALKGANKEFKRINFSGIAAHNLMSNGKKPNIILKRRRRLLKREEKRREKLKRLGISYEFPGFESEEKSKPAST